MELYFQLEKRGTVSSSSNLHRLVCCLIQLGKSKSKSLVEAVGVALGKLEPANLKTLILEPDLSVSDANTVLRQMEKYAQPDLCFS